MANKNLNHNLNVDLPGEFLPGYIYKCTCMSLLGCFHLVPNALKGIPIGGMQSWTTRSNVKNELFSILTLVPVMTFWDFNYIVHFGLTQNEPKGQGCEKRAKVDCIPLKEIYAPSRELLASYLLSGIISFLTLHYVIFLTLFQGLLIAKLSTNHLRSTAITRFIL